MQFLIVCSILMTVLSSAYGEEAGHNLYVSGVDKSLTVHRVGVLPVTDNAGGLYARYVETELRDDVKNAHRFDFREVKEADPRKSLVDYEENPSVVKKLSNENSVEALVGAHVNKTTSETTLTVDLFLATDGQILAQEVFTTSEKLGTAEMEKRTKDLVKKVFKKLPYQGMVISREGNRVTVDIGRQDGIVDNTGLTVAQIISVKRHPKFHFLVGTEKEVLGKIKIVKTDETLSFGVIIQETERGLITPDGKITGLDAVTYSDGVPSQKSPGDLTDQVSFGKNPHEWRPTKKPGLGKVGLQLGLGPLHNAVSTQLAGAFSTDVAIYPQIDLCGELWLTEKWYLNALIEQGVMSISNPNGGSSLGARNGYYRLHAGYKFLLEDDFFGPQLDVHLGFGNYTWFVDASNPTTFTSISYSGLYVGFGGSMPISDDRVYYLNAHLHYYLSPGLTETPVTSGGSSSNSGTEFSVGATKKLTEQLQLKADLDFLFFSTTFGGQGTRLSNGQPDTGLNASHSAYTLLGGVEYLF